MTRHRTWVEISLSQLRRNLASVRRAAGPDAAIAAVIKADAYGHGAAPIARALAEEGVEWFAVACAEEGVALRQAGIGGRVLVMGECLDFEREAVLEFGLTPSVHSAVGLAAWNRLAEDRGERLNCHLKIDSGLWRLGWATGAPELAAAIASAPWLRIEGLMTHFAGAHDFSETAAEEQIRSFDGVRIELASAGIAPERIHLASTNALAFGRRAGWDNLVRVGHALYGYVSKPRGPAPRRKLEVAPILSWKARIVALKEVPEGARIGYGGTYRADRPMRLAVLGLGYADGMPHAISNRGKVIARGRFAPIVGAVSMDMTAVDVTGIGGLEVGDPVTVLGKEGKLSLDAQEVARAARTISYNLLCGIGPRVKRIYFEEEPSSSS